MLDWGEIDTALLDMDGTLLDLHYDNHFWLTHVPIRYAEKHGMSLDASLGELLPRYQAMAGTMQWYCVDYWTAELGLDIARLKEEVRHLIAVHPHVTEFLESVRRLGKRVALVTNAHHKSLSLKMRHTGLEAYFDAVICAHALGVPKEHADFWECLKGVERYDPARTLLIDDSISVLRSARNAGIAHLLAVYRPDSRQPQRNVEEFAAFDSFRDIMPANRDPVQGR